MMQKKRRQFLKTAGLLAGGTIAASARSSLTTPIDTPGT